MKGVHKWSGWQKTALVTSTGCIFLERERQLGKVTNATCQGAGIGWLCTFPAKSPGSAGQYSVESEVGILTSLSLASKVCGHMEENPTDSSTCHSFS